jgi:hypothetical protein
MAEVEFAFLAEAAVADQEKGTFSVLSAPVDATLTNRVPHAARRTLVARVRWSDDELGRPIPGVIRLRRHGSENPPSEIAFTIEVTRSPRHDSEINPKPATNIIVDVPLLFTTYGLYSIELIVEEELLSELRYRIGPLPAE